MNAPTSFTPRGESALSRDKLSPRLLEVQVLNTTSRPICCELPFSAHIPPSTIITLVCYTAQLHYQSDLHYQSELGAHMRSRDSRRFRVSIRHWVLSCPISLQYQSFARCPCIRIMILVTSPEPRAPALIGIMERALSTCAAHVQV
jgi:hypothetical protein